MSPHNSTTKPQIFNKLPEHLQENPTLPQVRTPKRPRLAPKPPENIDKPLATTITPESIDSEPLLSPGHAPGYLQWKKAPAPDLASETEQEKKHRLNKRHAPKGKRGTRCIDDGTIDRSHAMLGQPDPSKLVVRFKTEEINEFSNKPIHGDVEFRYEDDSEGVRVDWNDKQSLHALNNWRNQVIRRNIGKVYDNKDFWTVQEQKILTELVRDYVNAKKDIDWTQIANDYNSSTENLEQDKGTPGAPRRYHCKSYDQTPREALCISIPLRESRQIPKRDDWVLRQEMGYFLAPDAIAVMEMLRSSGLPQKNGHPPARTRHESSQLGKLNKDKEAAQGSFDEQECSFASSTYETDRSVVEASPELAPTPPLRPLTQPRPLQPRQKAIVQQKSEPPRSRYKKRNVYNEEKIYDKPSTNLHRYSTGLNTSQGPGDRRQALDLLAEQAAILYDHLPEESKWSGPRPLVPTITPAPTAPAPAPIRFRPVTFGPVASTRNNPVRMPTAPMVPVSKMSFPGTPVPLASDPIATRKNSAELGSHQMAFLQTPNPPANPLSRSLTQPRPLVPRVPDREINRRMRETAGKETAELNAKKRNTSEPAPEN
ncbi:uncharacterized protein EAF01_001538 [Botrytis porri]|uniref:Myb-like domain-containing protein n=1 Tax=Botrytis porri TaxID=87229 RepID=A0A4Z1KT60_9HELO|nr:uncharacterized protein EAF01_001538 [Botrytis porri]KAF7912517.1 hypothetical protein EAF01_001538 [Botrytis porri]TGO87009.1 hypothetical protein BPOR_0259g00050 [Botrytis porri]